MLINIKVAGENDRCIAACNLFDFPYNQFGSLSASHDTHMIHVKVEEIELQLGFYVLKLSPGADANASCVPA